MEPLGYLCAQLAKLFTQKVCKMASVNRTLARISIGVGCMAALGENESANRLGHASVQPKSTGLTRGAQAGSQRIDRDEEVGDHGLGTFGIALGTECTPALEEV